MPYNYDLSGEEAPEKISPLAAATQEDYDEEEYDGITGGSPLSALMVGRAKELSPRRQDIMSRRDALLGAYKKLVEAQKYRALPVKDPGQWMAGAAGLMESQDPNMRAFGSGQIARAKAMMGEHEKETSAIRNEAMTNLDMNAADLGFLEKDQSLEMNLLKSAADNDNQQQMMQMKMLLAAMRNAPKTEESYALPDTETFKTLGVPQYSGPDPYQNMDNVGKRQLRMNYEKEIAKQQGAASEYSSAIGRMKRFKQLNEEAKDNVIGTGPIADYAPTLSKGLSEMETIAAELVPQMRTPGSGATSDFDAKMFQKATVGTNKDYEVNDNIATAYITAKENELQKADFLESYLAANGHLRGAQQKWKEYLDKNPIFSAESDPEDNKFLINRNRKTWQEHFSSGTAAGSDAMVMEDIPAPPAGYDAERWKQVYSKMTPEQRKLFGGQ